MTDVNLIPMHRRRAMQRNGRLRRWGAATFVYAALILTTCMTVRVIWAPTATASAEDLAQVQQRNAQLNQMIAQSRKQASEAQTAVKTAQAVIDQPDWSILLSLLSQTSGDDVVLRHVDVKPDSTTSNYTLSLRGAALSQASASKFILRLQDARLFDQVKLVRTGRENVMQTQAVTFEITCTINEEGRDKP